MKEESFSSFNEEPFDSSVIPREGEHVRLKSQLTKAEVRALQEFQQSFVHEGVIYNTQAIDDCSESLEKFKNDKKVSRERRQMIWEEHLSIKMNTEIARVLSNQKKKLAQEITFLMELKNDKDKWNMAIDLNFSEYLNATLLSASETIKQEYFASIHSTSGLTPLHCACKTNNADNVEFLLNMGANLKVLDQSGNTLFHLVVEYGYIDLFRKLLGHFKSIQDQKILSQCNHHGQSLLHLAAKKGRTEILMLLLEEFPDIVDEILNLETQEEKNTALHLAALYGHVECIRLLLQTPGLKGCVRNINGSIALHLAMKQTFHIDALMQVFLDFVPPDEKDTFDLIDEANGLNCLHLAILKSIRQFAIELIQQHKVQVNIPTSEGLSPLHLAVIVQSQEIVDALIQNGAIVDMVNNYGQTPLLQACLGGNLEIIRLLLKAGANPGHQNHQAHSVLHYLAAYCYDATLVEEIIERGADINATSIKLNTPLHFAGMNGNHVAAKVLLDHGANRNAINEDKKSVLFLAKKWNHKAVEDLIKPPNSDDLENNNTPQTGKKRESQKDRRSTMLLALRQQQTRANLFQLERSSSMNLLSARSDDSDQDEMLYSFEDDAMLASLETKASGKNEQPILQLRQKFLGQRNPMRAVLDPVAVSPEKKKLLNELIRNTEIQERKLLELPSPIGLKQGPTLGSNGFRLQRGLLASPVKIPWEMTTPVVQSSDLQRKLKPSIRVNMGILRDHLAHTKPLNWPQQAKRKVKMYSKGTRMEDLI